MTGPVLGIYPLYENVKYPKYATQRSACFDLSAYLGPEIICVDTYNRILMHTKRSIGPLPSRNGTRGFYIDPGECAFIPTGMIFDIPEGYKIMLYPRSGIAGKSHMKLGNSPAVIDEDYVEQTMILYFNDSQMRQDVAHGDRIAQAEIVPVYQAQFYTATEKPARKTDRSGGMGHTGILSN